MKLDAYNGKKTEFIISGDKLFVKSFDDSNDTFSLFRHTVTNGVVSAAEMLDTSIKACNIIGADVWYRRSVTGSSLCDLYKYSTEKRRLMAMSRLCRTSRRKRSYSKEFRIFFGRGDSRSLLIRWQKDLACSRKAELKNMKYSNKGISFIRSGGDLCIYSKINLL